MPLILAEELDTLTVEQIQEWDQRSTGGSGIFLNVIDKPCLTKERLERLQCLVRGRDEPSDSCTVNADELNARLRQISPRRSPVPSDTASTPVTFGADMTWEDHIEEARQFAYRNYEDLKNIGGRPSREINPDPGLCPTWKSDVQKQYHVPDHWNSEEGRTRRELDQWLGFRWHQFKMREDSNKFNKYKDAVYKCQQAKALDRTIELQLDQQTKLDEWWEYYLYEQRKRRALERKLDQAKKELEPVGGKFEEAKQNGSVGISESVLMGRRAEIWKYEEKILAAQKEVEILQKRLDAIKVEDSLSTLTRRMLLEEAEEDLKLAQKRLETEKSDEWEQLSKEKTRLRAQQSVERFQEKVNYASTCLQEWDTFLESIAAQSVEIATEYVSSSLGSSHHLMEEWGRCYAYMHKRLRWAQADEEMWAEWEVQNVRRGYPRRQKSERQEAIADLSHPLGRVRPIKALLAWFERAFPEMAARHTPLAEHDQMFHNGDQNEAGTPLPSKPPPNEAASKASRLEAGKSRRDKGKSAREHPRSPLRQVQPLKVSKPRRDGRQQAGVAVRRSERIHQQTHGSPPSGLRRSTRILNRVEKPCLPPSIQDSKLFWSGTMAKRKSARRTTANIDTACSKTPQGISKVKRWRAASKKKKKDV